MIKVNADGSITVGRPEDIETPKPKAEKVEKPKKKSTK